MTYVVELLVFAGATNPRFALTPGETEELQRLIASLAEPTVASSRPRLGYQGLVVYAWVPGEGWKPYLSVASGKATVLYGPGRGWSFRSKALEEHLVESARRAGHGKLLGHVLGE
jgi:hypothetical protein